MKQEKKHDTRNTQQKKPSAGKDKASSTKTLLIWNVVIAAIAFIAFSPALTGEFLGWDDYNYIKDNPLIRVLSWENIVHIFHYKTIVVGNYHPLTMLSYVIEYQLAGLNPVLYHFDNLALHLCNVALFSWLMWLLTKKTYATLIATALFALHPMRVESVVWAAERKDVLYTFFFLLSLIFYIHFLLKENRNIRYYLVSLLFFILSILSKGQAVVLPLTLFLVDYWYQRKTTIASVLNKVPFFIFSLASGILALVAQQSSLTEQRLLVHSLFDRLAIAAFNISAYLYKLVYPFNLSCFYKYPAIDDMGWVYAGAVFAIVVIAATAFFLRKNRVVVFGSLFFLFTISIVSQILPVGNAIIADRYTYIPYIGLFFIIGVICDQMITGKRKHSAYFLTVPIIFIVLFSFKTYSQARSWHDNETLWKSALNQDPDNGVAYTNLGKHYTDLMEYATAIDLLLKAIQNEATYSESYHAYLNLGTAYSRIGNYREAIRNFSLALARRPLFVEAMFNRGLSYTSIGQYDSAVADFTTIISKLDSLHIRSYYSRGVALNKLNLTDRAIADYSSAIRINPNYGNAYVNRGNIYFTREMFDPAIADYDIAIALIPDDGKIYLNRSFVYFKMHRYKEALDDALKAAGLKMDVPGNYITDLKNLAKAR
ncbi:MAG: tetratricopeptide repeat protein [Bacteroidales bacterium]|nr:tetratricopeptide repeat protein [Bacteroidales bacterium]